MTKKQIKQIEFAGLYHDSANCENMFVTLTGAAVPNVGSFRLGMIGHAGMLINMQDSMLVERIRYRILGAPGRYHRELKTGMISLDVNNWNIFRIPIQWVARTHRGFITDPNFLLLGSKHNCLTVQLDLRVTDKIPPGTEIAVQLCGWIIRNSTIIQ